MAIKNMTQTNEFDFAVHPGRILKKHLKALKMSQIKLSELSGIHKTVINEIINGKRRMTSGTAIKLEPIFELSATYWQNLQNLYDAAMKKIF